MRWRRLRATERVLALGLLLIVPAMTGTAARTAGHAAHSRWAASTATVPLESLPIRDNQNITVIAPGVGAVNRRTILTHGLQLNAYFGASGRFSLGGRYARLSGTLYGENGGDTTGARFVIRGVANGHMRPLYAHTATIDKERVSFSVAVRGVRTLVIACDQTSNDRDADLDVVAVLTPIGGATS